MVMGITPGCRVVAVQGFPVEESATTGTLELWRSRAGGFNDNAEDGGKNWRAEIKPPLLKYRNVLIIEGPFFTNHCERGFGQVSKKEN